MVVLMEFNLKILIFSFKINFSVILYWGEKIKVYKYT